MPNQSEPVTQEEIRESLKRMVPRVQEIVDSFTGAFLVMYSDFPSPVVVIVPKTKIEK